MADQVTVIQDISAPAERVWAMVSDLTRMGEWSPENEGATWRRGATGPRVGATFRGANRNGRKRWRTAGQVVDSQPGSSFVFRTSAVGLPIAEWRYEFQGTAAGCRVTETWIDRRGRIAKALGGPVSGVADRAVHNRGTMEQTLTSLKEAAEQPA